MIDAVIADDCSEGLIEVDGYTIYDLFEFNKISERIFDFIDSNKDDSTEYDIQKAFSLLLCRLLDNVFYRLEFIGYDYVKEIRNELNSLTNTETDIAYFDELNNKYEDCLKQCQNLRYVDKVKAKVEEYGYKFDRDIREYAESIDSRASILTYRSLIELELDFTKTKKEIKPKKIDKRDIMYVALSPKVVFIHDLIGTSRIDDLLNRRYTINKKLCKRIGVELEVFEDFIDTLVKILDDENCPKEVFDVYLKTIEEIPSILGELPDIHRIRDIINGNCKFGIRDNNDKFQRCLSYYKGYKKSNCYIDNICS